MADIHVTVRDWQRDEIVQIVPGFFWSIAFDPAGSRIALGTFDGPVELRDIESGERALSLVGHSGYVSDIAFSPDGSRIATAGADATVRLWDAKSGEQVLVLRGHTVEAWAVAFSSDGSKLVTGGGAGGDPVRVWALDLDDLIGIAKRNVTRALTDEECRQFLHMDQCPPA